MHTYFIHSKYCSANIQASIDCLETKRGEGCEFAGHLIHRFTVHSAQVCPGTVSTYNHQHEDHLSEAAEQLGK